MSLDLSSAWVFWAVLAALFSVLSVAAAGLNRELKITLGRLHALLEQAYEEIDHLRAAAAKAGRDPWGDES